MLKLELNECLKLTIDRAEEEENDKILKKTQSELIMQLWDKKSTKSALARKIVRWPIGQSLPNEISYEEQEEHILLKGATTQAEIPLPKSKLDSLTAASNAKTATSAKVKTFGAFAVNPIETSNVSKISKAITSVIDNPLKEKRWKQLSEKLSEIENGEASGALSATEQHQLVDSARLYAEDADSDATVIDEVFEAVVKARILTFRNEDMFLRLCVKIDRQKIVELVLKDSSRVISEYVLAELLRIAVGKSEKQKRKQIVAVLDRNFSKNAMIEATSEVLTSTEAVELMTVLADIYKEMDVEISLSKKALDMITILIDGHGSRIVYEDDLHLKFAAVSNFIVEMQSLVGTFEKLQCAIQVSKENDPSKCIVRRVQLVRHPLPW